MGSPELTQAALGYLGAGYHLLALHEKRPNTRYHGRTEDEEVGWSWEKSIHGVPETPEEIEALDEVFTHPSTTGIALLIPEHVLVADIDTEPAAALFAEMVPEVPETVLARTPKGLHIWFLAPGADASVWLGGRTLLFKGFGGYVAAPPSDHFNAEGEIDGVYTWLRGPETGMGWLPDALGEALKQQRALDARTPAKTTSNARDFAVPVDADGHWTRKGWGQSHMEGLVKAIIEAPDGNQNNVIAWAALVAQEEGVPYSEAMDVLLAAAVKGGHPRARAKATIQGAYKRRSRGR